LNLAAAVELRLPSLTLLFGLAAGAPVELPPEPLMQNIEDEP